MYLQHVHPEHDLQGVPEPEQDLLVKPLLSPAGSEDGAEEEDKQVEHLCQIVVKS